MYILIEESMHTDAGRKKTWKYLLSVVGVRALVIQNLKDSDLPHLSLFKFKFKFKVLTISPAFAHFGLPSEVSHKTGVRVTGW